MKKQLNILVCGNYGANNLGDEAILEAIVHLTQKALSADHDPQFTAISSDPESTKKRHRIGSVSMVPAGIRSFIRCLFGGSLFVTLREYKRADVILFGGGGLLSDEKPRAIFIWLMQILPALLHRKPVFCFGQSVGPLRSKLSRWIVRKIFKHIKTVTVRDEASRQLLNQLGIVSTVIPDPVFSFTQNSQPHDRARQIVLSLRPWKSGDHEKIYKEISQFIDWLFESHHLKTVLIPFQSGHDDDTVVLQKVKANVRHTHAVILDPYSADYHHVIDVMRSSFAVIGMRLHSLIFSALADTPFIALSYSQKVTQVTEQLGMKDYLIPYESIDLASLQKLFGKLFEHHKDLQESISEHTTQLRSNTGVYQKLIQDFISEHKF